MSTSTNTAEKPAQKLPRPRATGADWFQVDRKGLAALLERKGKAFALFELIQNAWDEDGVTQVAVILQPRGHGRASLIVTDDAPEGFKDLTHSYTLFAESKKKGDAQKRGRFNLGEKLFLALCDSAFVTSTTGGVRFNESGRHGTRARREAGTEIDAVLRMNRTEIEETLAAFRTLIAPVGITTTLNGEMLAERTPRKVLLDVSLATEIANADGQLAKATRQCRVEIYEPAPGETASLYEMGIPVVETEDRWHINIMQKVPLTMDRENVPPTYLRAVRAAVLNAMAGELTPADASAKWTTEALTDPNITPEATTVLVRARFGDLAVAYDPSDVEGTKIAVSKGYTVVHGGMLPAAAWQAVKAAGALLPAGQVTPSPKPYDPNGKPLLKYTPNAQMREVEAHAIKLARVALGKNVTVIWTCEFGWPVAATCGPDGALVFNVGTLGKAFFDMAKNRIEIDRLIIHEFGHLYVLDHLSSEYHEALCRIGALYAQACREGKL